MTATLCTHCLEQPTTAVLCDPCRKGLEEALVMLAAWSEPPPPIYQHQVDEETGKVIRTPEQRRRRSNAGTDDREHDPRHGRRPSSPFDIPSAVASRGGTKALARELDTLRARQARLGDMNGPRLAPDAKVWWPFEGGQDGKPLRRSRIDRIEQDLTAAVRTWIARLHSVDVDAPRSVATGHVLARGCTWLLWHVSDLATHPLAAEAVSAFESVAARLETLVDRPQDRVYVGPCWATSTPAGGPQPECLADLYAKPGKASVQCRVCGHVVGVEDRKVWLGEHLEEVELTATNCSRALATIGLAVSVSQITMWATRETLLSRGRVSVGQRSLALYRVGDVMLLAYTAAADPRRRKEATA